MTDQVETPVAVVPKMASLRGRYAGVGHCGDAMAAALATLNLAGVEKLATDYGLGDDVAKYAHLNNGQRRMNLGNKLRGLTTRKENTIPVEDVVAAAQDLAVQYPKEIAKPKTPRKAKAEAAAPEAAA